MREALHGGSNSDGPEMDGVHGSCLSIDPPPCALSFQKSKLYLHNSKISQIIQSVGAKQYCPKILIFSV